MPDTTTVSVTRLTVPLMIAITAAAGVLSGIVSAISVFAVDRYRLEDISTRVGKVEARQEPTSNQIQHLQDRLDNLQKDSDLLRAGSERMEQNSKAALDRIEAELQAQLKAATAK